MQNCPSVVCSGLIFLACKLLLVWVLAPSVLAISPLIVVWNIVAHSHSQGSCGWKQWLLPACRSLSGSGSLCLPLYTMETHVDVFFRVKAGRSSYGDSALGLACPHNNSALPLWWAWAYSKYMQSLCTANPIPLPWSDLWSLSCSTQALPTLQTSISGWGVQSSCTKLSILASTHGLLCSPLRLRSSPST